MKIKKKKNTKAPSATKTPSPTMHRLRHRSMRTQVESIHRSTLDLIHELEKTYADVKIQMAFGRIDLTYVELVSRLHHVKVEAEKTLAVMVKHAEVEYPGGIPDTV